MFKKMCKYVSLAVLVLGIVGCSSVEASSNGNNSSKRNTEISWAVGEASPYGRGERATLSSVSEDKITVAARSNVGWYTLTFKVRVGTILGIGSSTYKIEGIYPETNYIVVRDVSK